MRAAFRRPESVIVVVYSDDGYTLLLHRTAPFEFWQSVTGSLQDDESHTAAAKRELFEETGLSDEGVLEYSGISRQFAIDPRWRERFAPGVVENVEFEYRYRLDRRRPVLLSDEEHSAFEWLSLESAVERVWSWTNRDALLNLLRR